MEIIGYSEARNHLADLMTRVCDSHEPVVINRKNGGRVVMISLEDFGAMQKQARHIIAGKRPDAVIIDDSGRLPPSAASKTSIVFTTLSSK